MRSKWVSVIVSILAIAWGAVWAIDYHQPPFEQDVDSWAVKITNTYPQRIPIIELFRDPSLWKGPIVPTLFHLSYVIYPSCDSPIALNVLCLGLAAGLLHRLGVVSGFHPIAVFLGVMGWVCYPPFRFLFGLYFAEPIFALLSTCLLWCVLRIPHRPMIGGMLAGVLLLARAPFLFVVAAIPVVLWMQGERKKAIVFALGTTITFLPWGIRNTIVTGTFVPFTVEGGQTLFHGSYLPVDDVHWQTLKELPDVKAIDDAAPKDPIERMKYLSGVAKKQVFTDPMGQSLRSLRKAQRFWMDVDADTYVPNRNTGIAAMIILPLAVIGAIRNRKLAMTRWMIIWIVGLWAMHAIVFGLLRYSYPVFPLATILAAGAIFPARRYDDQQWPTTTIPPRLP